MRRDLENLSDDELASMAGRGDERAFEEIYDRHAEGVAGLLASYVGPDRQLLDDLTQEVFFRVIKHLPSYAPTHPFSHWLYTIALNVGRNHVRRPAKLVFLDTAELEAVAGGTDKARGLSEQAILAALARVIPQLPEKLLDVLSLRIGSGMPYGEISEVLGIPVGTARRRMHTALNILRAKLGMAGLQQAKKKEER